jgi:selenoprotein W-related protein
MAMIPVIEITYCRLCGWGLRAGWMAQELLTTFAEELGSVTQTPDRTGGVFEVRVDDEVIWSRKERGPLSGNQGDQAARPRPRRSRSLARAYGHLTAHSPRTGWTGPCTDSCRRDMLRCACRS